MSSSVVSSASRAPPRRLTLRRRASRSRSRSSWSVAIRREETQEPSDEGSKLRPGHDRVEVAEAVIRLGDAEVVRQLLARRLLDDARAGEGHQRAGLRDDYVAERREA